VYDSSGNGILPPDPDCHVSDPNIYSDVRLLICQIADKTLGKIEHEKLQKVLLPMIDTFFSKTVQKKSTDGETNESNSQTTVKISPDDFASKGAQEASLCKPITPQVYNPTSCQSFETQRTTREDKKDKKEENSETVPFSFFPVIYRSYSQDSIKRENFVQNLTKCYRSFVDTVVKLIQTNLYSLHSRTSAEKCLEFSLILFAMDRLILWIGKQLNNMLNGDLCTKLTGI